MKYSCILFDLDGTLVYSHEGIFWCFRYALDKMGRQRPTDDDLRDCVGPPLEDSFRFKFNFPEEDALRATAHYREEYKRKGQHLCYEIPKAKEMLAELKRRGYKTALATSKAVVFAKQIVERLGFAEYLDEIVGSGVNGELPTKADVVAEVLRRTGEKAENCLMVGDKAVDIIGARACGVDGVALKVGYALEGELEGCDPDYLFDGFDELLALL